MFTLFNKVMVCLLVIGLAGCSPTYLPSIGSIDPNVMPPIGNGKTVRIVNVQTSSESVQVGKVSEAFIVHGDFKEWTAKAIKKIKKELSRKGYAFNDGAQKVLEIAITQAYFVEAMNSRPFDRLYECAVRMEVATGDHQQLVFVGQKTDPSPRSALNRAFTDSISIMLSDEKVQTYLME